MPEAPHHFSAALTAASAAETSLPLEADDIALGCECAYPVLQIDCWTHESVRSGDVTPNG